MSAMDCMITPAIVKNDMDAFRNMVEKDEQVLDKRIGNTTVLHLASKYGNVEMVSLILELRPEKVGEENNNSETPIHEACRMGHDRVVRLLMEANQWVATKLNSENQSALFLACNYGNFNIVNLLLDNTCLLVNTLDDAFCLHVAASRGRTDIAKKLLERCPYLANQKDGNGSLALHVSCKSGQPEITAILLRMDPDQALQFDNSGYTPLHLAAMNGNLAILEEFASIVPYSFQILSKHGETVFHLTIRYDKFDAFKYVDGILKGAYLFFQPDNFGNTIQHLARIRGFDQFSEYIYRESKERINHQFVRNHSNVAVEINGDTNFSSQTTKQEEKHITAHKKNPKTEHIKSLQNARNTITLVAILISTIAYTTFLNPHCGIYQDGPLKGMSIMGKKQAFRNHIALFLSLCFVVVLVSVISFRRKPLKLILSTAFKVMWVALSFMPNASHLKEALLSISYSDSWVHFLWPRGYAH